MHPAFLHQLSYKPFYIISGRGVLSWYSNEVSIFLSDMPPEESAKITPKHGKNGSTLVEEILIKNVGSPLADLLEYLGNEHLTRHCLPSNVSSGLGTLPVDHVYYNSSKTSQRTNQRTLKGGERIIPGKKSYRNFMSFSTAQNITPGNFSLIRNSIGASK